MAKFTEVRLTLAAFIYGIEIDLKSLLTKYIAPYHLDLGFMRNLSLEETVKKRFEKDNLGINISDNIDLAVEYLDFQDVFTILLANELF